MGFLAQGRNKANLDSRLGLHFPTKAFEGTNSSKGKLIPTFSYPCSKVKKRFICIRFYQQICN